MFFNVSPMPFEFGDCESAEVRLLAGCASRHFWYRSWKKQVESLSELELFVCKLTTHLASSFDSFTESAATWLAAESMSDKFILCCMNNEGAVFNILSNAQEA